MKSKAILFLLLLLPIILTAQATELFFSEYVEGASYNKALEIFNPSDQTADLSGYLLRGTSNEATDWEYDYPFPAGATIAPGATYVICDPQASDDIKALSNWVASGYECSYNGNDSRGLFKQDGQNYVLLDVIGNPNNPSAAMYDVAGVSSGLLDYTIIRKSSVSEGNPDWVTSSGTNADDSEWIVMDKDDITDLGQHTFDGGAPSTGDGEGVVTVSPNEANIDTTLDLEFSFTGVSDFTLTDIKIAVPSGWTWSGNVSDVVLSGTGFSVAVSSVTADTIFINSAGLTDIATGGMTLQDMTAPSAGEVSTFSTYTAVSGGTLTEIKNSPYVRVIAPAVLVTIEDIQNDFGSYNGQTVVVEAVVAIGVNVTRTDRCDVFVQDASGRGINLSDASTAYPDLNKGNLVRIEGTVSDYNGTTQIESFTTSLISSGNPVPGIVKVSTLEAGNLEHEGTMIETSGIVSDIWTGGGGTSITINDGSGDIQMRIWDTSGLDLSDYSVGDTLGVRGIIDEYNSSPQLLVGYQEDLFKVVLIGNSDGKGSVTVVPDSVGLSESADLEFEFALGTYDTLGRVELTVPAYWTWSATAGDVALAGAFSSASLKLDNNVITLDSLDFTAAENGQITVMNLTTPAVDTSSVFSIRTASADGSLKGIQQNPVVLVGEGTGIPYISIEEARTKVDSVVTIKGVITIGAGILRTDMTTAFIQDESGYGLNVFWYGVIDEDIKRGNLVLLTGTITEYNGVLEIENYTATVLKAGVPIPAVRKLSTAEAFGLAYEGSFIEVTGIITDIWSAGGGTSIEVDDGTGSVAARIWDTAGLDVSGYAIGDFVTIRGVIGVYNDAGQILLGYAEDIFAPVFDGTPVLLSVIAKPFVPERGEVMPIEYSAGAQNSHITLRIFDMAGRLVTTLKDGAGLPFTVVKNWDGKNVLGDYVAIGSYICHLEVVNDDTGKRTVKLAPIVVGTVLK